MIRGRAHKFGSNIDTDGIIPARYLNVSEPEELARHCMEDVDPDFLKKMEPGDVIVAGANFGCGSSREHAPLAIKAAGISCVIASSFARIFYRNAINIGLPLLESGEAYQRIEEGDILEVDLENGTIKDVNKGVTLTAKPYPPFMREIISSGGLVEYTRRRIKGLDGN